MEPLEARKVAGLPPVMQMTYWTGAAVQNDVALEHALTGVYFRLAGAGSKWPAGVARLASGIRDFVAADRIGDAELSRLALGLLDAVDQAQRTRNRLVHDLWAPSSMDDSSTFSQLLLRGQTPRGPSTRHLDEFRACAAQLAICEFRATALGALLDHRRDSASQDDDLSWRAVLAGDVELTEGGGYRITRNPDV
jgi:hypothetical protein